MNALKLVASLCRKISCPRVSVHTPISSVGAIVALLIGFISPEVKGYVLEGPSWPAGSVVIFQLNLGNPNSTLQDGSSSWNAAVAPALDMWNQNILRIQTTSLNTPLPATSGDRLNTAVFSSTIYGQSFGKGTLAVTYYRSLGSNLTEADILFNSAQNFDSYRGRLQFASDGTVIADIQRVFLHELGHAIGLGHPDGAGQTVDAVMNSITSNRDFLAQDDINGGQFLYGAPLFAPPTPTPSATPTATPTATPNSGSVSHLANISTRLNVGLGENVMIGGFIITGSDSKKVLLRAIGPSLASAGITGTMQNPYLELHDSSGATIASDDDWQTGGQRDQIIATGAPPQNDLESAIVATIAPGNYTALLRGVNETTGIALVETYELDSTTSRLANISTRGHVGLDQNVMIAGFIVQGSAQKKVIVRALGPSLNSNSSVQGEMADPYLELYDGNGALLAANDDWVDSPQYAEIVASTVPPPDRRESAVVATLPPGNFTAIMRGANFTQGIGLVEVYDLDK
ncbi:MAG TPA: matrixin family metalloprotease [Chthoniobacterales bacterium]|nr:matrixin family metalloprotease [Chthoniobacterales bacterium]